MLQHVKIHPWLKSEPVGKPSFFRRVFFRVVMCREKWHLWIKVYNLQLFIQFIFIHKPQLEIQSCILHRIPKLLYTLHYKYINIYTHSIYMTYTAECILRVALLQMEQENQQLKVANLKQTEQIMLLQDKLQCEYYCTVWKRQEEAATNGKMCQSCNALFLIK